MSHTAPRIQIYCFHGIIETYTDPLLEHNFCTMRGFLDWIEEVRKLPILGLNEIAENRSDPYWKERDAVVITFDDGHYSNLWVGDTLMKYGIPWATFVCSAAVGAPEILWSNRVDILLLHGAAESIDLLGQTWPLLTRFQRKTAYFHIRRHLKKLIASERKSLVHALEAQFPADEFKRLLEIFPSFGVLSWRDLDDLHSLGVTIGSHGVCHEIHHNLQQTDTCEKELIESKTCIEQNIKANCEYFAFPNGNYNGASSNLLAKFGYKLGFTLPQIGSQPLEYNLAERINPIYLLPKPL